MPGASGLGYYTEQAFLKQFPGETITSRTQGGQPVASFSKPGKLGTFFAQHMVGQMVEAGLWNQGVPPSGKTPATVRSITVSPKGGETVDIPRNATREQVDALIKRRPASSNQGKRPSGKAVATSWPTRNKAQSKAQSKDQRGNLLEANLGKKTLIGA